MGEIKRCKVCEGMLESIEKESLKNFQLRQNQRSNLARMDLDVVFQPYELYRCKKCGLVYAIKGVEKLG